MIGRDSSRHSGPEAEPLGLRFVWDAEDIVWLDPDGPPLAVVVEGGCGCDVESYGGHLPDCPALLDLYPPGDYDAWETSGSE